ncbi:MAG: iron-regulated protein [Spirochaetia bacterium]|nr:iron-regulated protein [Spirochaetia bacterium]
MKKFQIAGGLFACMLLITAGCKKATKPDEVSILKSYAEVVYQSYKAAHADAKKMQTAIDALLAKPGDDTLAAARKSWLEARESYGPTEAFRFYQGPIDAAPGSDLREGPEGLLNSWPLDEAYIDYVKGNPKAGIINSKQAITRDALVSLNQKKDERDVSTGFHAIEFLLWGQAPEGKGAGNRPATDYKAGNPVNERRRQYLKLVTTMAVEDLAYLESQWEPGKNYAARFTAEEPRIAIGKILTSLATLSGFELASERIGDALTSGDRKDQQSCFSNNTNRDYVANVRGLLRVYSGTFETANGPGVKDLIAFAAPDLSEKITSELLAAEKAASQIGPLDAILSSPAGSKERESMIALQKSLLSLSKLLEEAGAPLNTKVEVVRE